MLKQFFYFGAGERRALTILLIITISGWGYLAYYDLTRADDAIETAVVPLQKQDSLALYPYDSFPPTTYKKEVKATKGKVSERKTSVSSREFRATKSLYKKYPRYTRVKKLPKGSIVELNTADTTLLKQVPGLGTVFAKRIVSFRRLLGGYASVSQLQEVYGIDAERYESLKTWFKVDASLLKPLVVNRIPFDSLVRHPYVNYQQARIINRLVKQKGRLQSIEELRLLDEFTPEDWKRLPPYLDFQ